VNEDQPKICVKLGHAWAQRLLVSGLLLMSLVGTGVAADIAKLRRTAEAGDATAQYELGRAFDKGKGVEEDELEASRWYARAGRQGHKKALYELGDQHFFGAGDVPFDRVRSYAYWDLAAARGHFFARLRRNALARFLTAGQVASATIIGQQFMAGGARAVGTPGPAASGTAFFISSDGYLVTNEHVVGNATKLTAVQGKKKWPVKVIAVDAINDLAVLKIDGGSFKALPVISSRRLREGSKVFTFGHPNPSLQGLDAVYTSGEISKLSGIKDDPRMFQISVPIQAGNSGGALVDEHGNVVGVVVARLNALKLLAETGKLPQNVNYAVKSTRLLLLLEEQIPKAGEKLKESHPRKSRDPATVRDEVKQATVLILVERGR